MAEKDKLSEFLKNFERPKQVEVPYRTEENDEVAVSQSPTAVKVLDKKTGNAKVSNASIEVDGEVEAPKAEVPAPAEIPAKKPEGPYVPMAAQSSGPVTGQPKQVSYAQPMEQDNVWERAMIGATPLLVGLLSGNRLEGTDIAAKRIVGEEADLYKRTKDFNSKLAEMKMKRDLAGADGKNKFDKTEVFNPETGKKEMWSMVNGQRYEYLGQGAPDASKDKFGQVVVESEKLPGRYETWSTLNGEKYKPLGMDFKKEDVVFKEALNPDTGKNEYKMFTRSGDDLGFVAQMPEGARKYGMSLEDRMAFAKYQKDLKAPELKFKQERDLNKDREGVVTTKNTRELSEAHGKIFSSSFGKDPVTDIATVISLFKMLDPGSVVRESELALGISAKSYEDWANNAPGLLMKQGYLTPKQRENIRGLADKMYKQQLAIQESSVDSNMKNRAKNYGLNSDFVAPPIKSPYKPEGKPLKVKQDGVEYTLNPKTGEYE